MTNSCSTRPHLIINAVLLAILLVGLGVLASFDVTANDRVYVPWLGQELRESCVYKLQTGYPCPSCGITRSLVTALHGDWSRSGAFHFAGIPLLLLALGQIAMRIAFLWRRLRCPAMDIAVSAIMLICVGVLLNG